MEDLNDLEDDVQLEITAQEEVHGSQPSHAEQSPVVQKVAQHQRSRLKRLDAAAAAPLSTTLDRPLHTRAHQGHDSSPVNATQQEEEEPDVAIRKSVDQADSTVGCSLEAAAERTSTGQDDVSGSGSPAAQPSVENITEQQADDAEKELEDEGFWDEEDEYAQTLGTSQKKPKPHSHSAGARSDASDDEGSVCSGSSSGSQRDSQQADSDGEADGDEEGDAGSGDDQRVLRDRVVRDRIGGGSVVEVEEQNMGGILANLQARRAAVAARSKAHFAHTTVSSAAARLPAPTVAANPVDLGSLLARVKAKQQQQQVIPAAAPVLEAVQQASTEEGMETDVAHAGDSVGISREQGLPRMLGQEPAGILPEDGNHMDVDTTHGQCGETQQGDVDNSEQPQSAQAATNNAGACTHVDIQAACDVGMQDAEATQGQQQGVSALIADCGSLGEATFAAKAGGVGKEQQRVAVGIDAGPAAAAGAASSAQVSTDVITAGVSTDVGDEDDDLEIVEDPAMAKGGQQGQGYNLLCQDDECSRPASQPGQPAGADVDVLPVRKGTGPLTKCRLLGKTGTARLSRLGSVQLVNHGVMPAAGQKTVGTSRPAEQVGNGTAGTEPLKESNEEDDIDGVEGSKEEEEEEELLESEEGELGSGSEGVVSGDEEGDEEGPKEGRSGEEDEHEAEEGEGSDEGEHDSGSGSEDGDNADEELEAEPLAYEEMEPELEDDEPERGAGRHAGGAAPVDAMAELMKQARQKKHNNKPQKSRGAGGRAFIEVEAELSDDEAAVGGGPMSDEEDEDDLQDDGMLADLIGTAQEGAMDELRRARLHKEWEAERDANEIRQVVHALRHGHKRNSDQRDMLGGEDGTDVDARRRRAQLFGDVQMEAQEGDNTQGMAEWAQALNQIAMADGEEVEEEQEEGGEAAEGAAAKQAAEQREMRKRLRTASSVPEEGAGLSSLARRSSSEVRAAVQAARSSSLPHAGSKPGAVAGHKPQHGQGTAALNRNSSGNRPPARATTQFNVFGRDLTNKGSQPQGTSFVGRAPAATHRSTSNAGRSFVFGTSEASNPAAGDSNKDGSAGGKPGSASGKPTSFAGMKGLLGAGASGGAALGRAQGGNPLAKQHQQQQAKQGNSLFNLLNDKSASNHFGF